MLVLKSDKIDFEFVKKISEIYKHHGNLEEYEFDVKDHTIDLSTITPWVRDNMGSQYCMAHLRALKICKDKLKGG